MKKTHKPFTKEVHAHDREAHEKVINIIEIGARGGLQIKALQTDHHIPVRMIGILVNNKKEIVVNFSTWMILRKFAKIIQCHFVKMKLSRHTLGDHLGSS